jgi:hypothetical protein
LFEIMANASRTIRMGSPFVRTYTLRRGGVPRNLSGSTFVFRMRGRNGMLTFSGPAVTVNAPAGQVTVSLTAEQTMTLFENNMAECYLVETRSGVSTTKAKTYIRILTPDAAE